MPEIKHQFTGGKMNKDLDERLIRNGEYRDAMNIQVSTSEGSDVGTAQNILGNSLIAGQSFIGENAVCVGSIADEKNDKLYYFIINNEELIVNGGFDGDSNSWVLGTGWAYANGKIEGDSVALYNKINQSNLPTNKFIVGREYEISFTVSNYVQGDLKVNLYNENGDGIIIPSFTPENKIYTFRNKVESSITTDVDYYSRFWIQRYGNAGFTGDIDNISIKSINATIIEYDANTNAITPVLVDVVGDVLQFSSDRLITGINIIDDMIFWTDNYSEPKKINIPRCIKGTNKSGTIHTKLINESRDIDISSDIDLEEKHITVIRKSPRTAPTIELISERDPDNTYSGIMRITTDPGGLVPSTSGANQSNTQNASSLWFSEYSHRNHLYDFSTLTVGDWFRTRIETDINGDSGFDLDWSDGDTVVFKEFSGDTYDDAPSIPITDYTIKAKIISHNWNNYSDSVAELAPNGDFTLPDTNGSMPLGFWWSNGSITYDSLDSKIVFDGAGAWERVTGTPDLDFVYGTGSAAGVYKVKFEIQGMTTGSTVQVKLISNQTGASPHNWNTPTVTTNSAPGIPHEFDLTLDTSLGSSGGNFSWAAGKFFIRTTSATNNSFEILNISIERQDISDAGMKFEVLGINGTPAIAPDGYSELRYAVDLLDEEENLFEFKFPRFAYRYQYEDKEYSAFSPFTEVAFLPGSFDFHPQKGYNLGMTNGLKEISIKGFVPGDGLADDVVAVDILYKDEASPNIYVIDTIKNNQHGSDIWTQVLGGEGYIIKSEAVKRVLPSNQLLRPWDAVPKKALAQEISGNRIIYGNYTQGFDLLKPGTKQEYYPDFDFSIHGEDLGLNTVKSIKSLREYQLGVVFVDKYGRETPVLSNASGLDKVAKNEAAKSNKMEVSFGNTVFPEDMEYFKFFVKETSGEYYNMTMDRWWDAGDGLAWLSFGSADINKIDIDTFLILKKGVESNDLVTEPARYKVLAIETEAPDHIKTKKTLIEEKKHTFVVNTTTDIFGNTIDNAPLLGRDTFKMRYQPFASGPGSELHNIEDGILYVEFAFGSVVSKRYRVTELTTDRDHEDSGGNVVGPTGAMFSVKLDKNLGDDINFICNDPDDGLNATKIIDETLVRFYKYTPENSSEFDGRFFVKVISDGVFVENITTANAEVTQYRTTLSRKLYYMGSNQALLHQQALTGQTHGLYADNVGADDNGVAYQNENNFGRFAPFFRNYKWGAATEQQVIYNSNWGDPVPNVGQYRFDDTSTDEWKDELKFHTANLYFDYTYNDPGLKNADHSGWNDEVGDASTRYGVFNSSGEQTKGNVWFIDGGPYAGNRGAGETNLHWTWHGTGNGFGGGVVAGNTGSSHSSIRIAMGGIYTPSLGNNVGNVFNIGSNNNVWYNGQKFKDLVGKISPSVKFRFREDPTGEIYTIKPSGVTYENRLRWSDGGKKPSDLSGEYPAYSGSDYYAPQLSPNITRGYVTQFTNDRTDDGTMGWDPTNGGATGAIDGGLHLTATRSQTPSDTSGFLPMVKVSVTDIHDLTCSVNGGKHSITKGMILTSYGGTTLDGTFTDPNGTTGGSYSHEPLIVESITGSGPYNLYLTGYSSPILNSDLSGTDLLKHKIFVTAPASGESMVFQQPAMNGYSQYSVNRINVQDANGDGSSLSTPALLAVGYTIEFLEEIEGDVEFPDNPAIWETEPKESTDLDIYYEASGYNPFVLTEDNKHAAIPINSPISHDDNPNSIVDGTTVKGVYLFDGSTQSPPQITSSMAGTTTNYYILTQSPLNPFSTAPLVGGVYINVNDTLSIERPDGSVISVTVRGWMNEGLANTYSDNRTEMIFIQKLLHGPDTKYTLNWHNCYSFGNGVESNRIRDTYNLPYIANGVKASTTLDEHPYEESLKYGLIYSGIYNGSVGINNLNQFIAAEKISKDINPTYGSIQKLKAGWGQGGDLITLCEDRVLKIMANKDAIYNADGNPQLIAVQNVLGQALPYSGEFGISKNPESFASEAYRAYFTDKVRGSVMRLSKDGLTPISDAGMKDWFRDNLKLSTKLIGSFDDRNDEYNITLADRKVLGEELIVNGNLEDEAPENIENNSGLGGWFMSGGPHWFWDGVNKNLYSDAYQHSRVGQYLPSPVTIGKSYEISYTVGKPVSGELEGRLWVTLHDDNANYMTISANTTTTVGTYTKIVTVDNSWPAWQWSGNLETSINFHNKTHAGSGYFNGTIDNISVKEIISDPTTVSFREDVKGWVSFKSFVPESALSTANNYYTVLGGRLYKHHVENADRNTFYNNFTNSSLNVILNDMPSSIKSYHTLDYEGSQSRVEGVKKVEVTGIEHAVGPASDGQYFFFEVSDMNALLNNSNWDETIVEIKQYRYNALIREDSVKIWGNSGNSLFPASPSGGPTKGHGRYNTGAQPGDFEVGDVITTQLQEDYEVSMAGLNTTTKDGWYVSSITTDKEKGSLLEFVEKEGKWFNYIKGIESAIDETTDFGSFDIQGIGVLKQTITSSNSQDYQTNTAPNESISTIETYGWDWYSNRMEFDGPINASLQIGDTIYYQQDTNSTMIKFGKITNVYSNSILVDETVFGSANIPDPTYGAFIFFVKNQVVNMNGLSGYYADAKFENNSKVKAELFAVSSEVTESSK